MYDGERLDTSSLWYGLFDKSIELGMWNVNGLVDEIGFEEDREVWASLEDDEREQVRRILAAFLDGEFEVGADAEEHLIPMMDAPCLEDNEMKKMYMTAFTLTEHKHTQFFDLYIRNVVNHDREGDETYTGMSPRGGSRVPIVEATGVGEVFDHQGLLTARAAHTHDPVDIAKAATNYHLNVEGVLARTGFYAVNKMSDTAPLPLLNRGFKLVSTDEGRHITHGVRLLNELVEKERDGVPECQGVSDGIVEVLEKDVPHMAEFAYMITESVGDPLDVGVGNLLMRGAELIDGTYNEALGLGVDRNDVVMRAREHYQTIDDDEVAAELERVRRRYDAKRAGTPKEGAS